MTFHLIVCCVKSKQLKGPSFQTISPGPIEDVHTQWLESLSTARKIGPLQAAKDLYKGAVWKSYLKVYEALPYPKSLWIISAGYGFVSGHDRLTGYEATFQLDTDSIHGHIEDIGNEAETSLAWWHKLTQSPPLGKKEHPQSLSELMQTHSQDHFVMVASKAYLNAVRMDLAEGLSKLKDPDSFLLISNSKDMQVPAIVEQWPGLLPYIPGAEKAFKCPRLTVNSQIAHHLISQVLPDVGWNHQAFAQSVKDLEVHTELEPQRGRLTDESVKEHIIDYLKWAERPSKSAALKFLRDRGLACEQKRFGELFNQTQAEWLSADTDTHLLSLF